MVRTPSIHTLYPVVKLADGTMLAGNRGISTDGEFMQVEVAFVGMKWFKLDPVKVVASSEFERTDLSKVDEVGLVTLALAADTVSQGRRICQRSRCSRGPSPDRHSAVQRA